MSATVLYPYPTLNGEAVFTVARVRLDGKPKLKAVNAELKAVDLSDTTDWKRAFLDLEVTVPAAAVKEFEDEHGPLAAVAVAHCLPTNGREQVRLDRSPTDPSRWTRTFELDRDNHRGRVKLEVVLTAAVGGVPHRPVAAANGWAVYFDQPETLRLGKGLPVKWANFEKEKEGSLPHDYRKSTHVVEFGQALPTVLLNSAFTDLKGLLEDRKGRTVFEKGLHDTLRTGIARSVWLTLLTNALADISEPEEGTAVEWPETPWRAEVLRLILPEVMPGKSDVELLALALAGRREAGEAATLFARAEAVIGDVVKANEHLRRFVQKHAEESIQHIEEGIA